MEDENSIPAPSDNDAGGEQSGDKNPADSGHSQDEPKKDAAEKQGDDADKKGDDGQPSKSADDKPAEGDEPKDGEESDDKDAPASKFDDDLDEWAVKRGYEKPENDKERRLLQDIRNGQRDFHGKQGEKSKADVDKAIKDTKPEPKKDEDEDDDRDPAEVRAANAEKIALEERNLRLRSEFFTENDVSAEESKAMGEILKEKVEKAQKVSSEEARKVYDYWTNPDQLGDWHALAKARVGGSNDTSSVEEEAARKERERIAKETNAKSPGRSASKQTPSDKTEGEKRLERFSGEDAWNV